MPLRLLCVDDEPDILLVLGLSLRHTLGAEVTALGSSADVLPWLEANPAPDAVVLDAMMPGIDGYEVCRRIRADRRYDDVAVVFLTARALVSELGEGVAAGADGVLSKPFDPMTVGRDLGAILDAARRTRGEAGG
jgi:two-component system, OmpR family, response regulator